MPAQILDGRCLAETIRREVKESLASLGSRAPRAPGLSVVLVGRHPASMTYVRSKARAAEEVGIRAETLALAETTSTAELLGHIEELNRREDVDAILVQLPLPARVDTDRVLVAVSPAKDVDGFHPWNMGKLLAGRPGFVPCTPAGVLELLRRSGVEVAGQEAVIVGRSDIVGKPLALLLLHAHATVTLCHSRTRDLPSVTRRADILVAAIGQPGLVTDEHVKPGATVIDVGINRLTELPQVEEFFPGDRERTEEVKRRGYTLVGDCHPARVSRVAGLLTPVPGGVGPLTIALLLRNTLDAFRQHVAT